MANPEITYPLLCLDTSTPSCSVCLINESRQVFKRMDGNQNSHSEILFTQVREVILEAKLSLTDIKTVLVTSGPGSYTGLRIAASALKGWFFESDIQLYAVETLPFLAYHASDLFKGETLHMVAILDARRKHVYAQNFSFDGVNLVTERKAAVEEISWVESNLTTNTLLIGTGTQRFSEGKCIKAPIDICDAECLYKIAMSQNAEAFITPIHVGDFEPDYMGTPV